MLTSQVVHKVISVFYARLVSLALDTEYCHCGKIVRKHFIQFITKQCVRHDLCSENTCVPKRLHYDCRASMTTEVECACPRTRKRAFANNTHHMTTHAPLQDCLQIVHLHFHNIFSTTQFFLTNIKNSLIKQSTSVHSS